MVISLIRNENKFLKDDYVQDVEGIIYLVILNDHPSGSVVVIPKYIPKQGGEWRGTYSRLFRNYTSDEFHKAALSAIFRKYEFFSNSFGKKLLAIPYGFITQHHLPENKAKELISFPRKDLCSLEKKAVDLIRILSEFGIEQKHMGITGSLLYDLHMPFSNLNIILYGLKATKAYLNKIGELVTENKSISFKSQSLNLGDRQIDLGTRIRTFLWVNDVSTAIHVNEFPDFQYVYGSKIAHNLGNCEIDATINNIREGFIRKCYFLHIVNRITWPDIKGPVPETLKLKIFSGRSEDIIFRDDELVRACGVLQQIESADKRQEMPSLQLSVGLEEFPGYVYPLSIFPA